MKKTTNKKARDFRKEVEKLNEIQRKHPEELIQWLIDAEQIPEKESCFDHLKVVKLIKKHRQEILKQLFKDKGSFDDYNFIKKAFKAGNINNNDEFKKVYKRFYVLNGAGLTPVFIDKYFKLLNRKETDLEKILVELSKIRRRKGDYSVQLSFASKLIHTIDNNQPIYDSRVAELLNIKPNYSLKGIDDKKIDRIRICHLLKERFSKILNNQEVAKIIKDFKDELKSDIGDVKMLDFILWKLGSIIIKK